MMNALISLGLGDDQKPVQTGRMIKYIVINIDIDLYGKHQICPHIF